ncbi:MAG: GAF domain-containing protein [Chloroflexota bacterium]|jgi:PAS domain S-box-containing protein
MGAQNDRGNAAVVRAHEPGAARNEALIDREATLLLRGDRVVACNEAALTLFSCQRETLLGNSFLDLSVTTQPNGRGSAESLRIRTAAALAEQRQSFEWLCRRPDDGVFMAQITLDRVKVRDNSYVRVVLQPIIHKHELEEQLLRFKLGIERSNDAVFMTDVAGRIIFANPAFERIYGYSVDEVIGKTPRILKSGVLSEELYEEFWATLLRKEVVAGEIINRTKDGRLIYIDGANNPILDEEDRLIGFLAIHRDITDRKEAQAALEEAQKELEQRVDERTTSLAEANLKLQEQYSQLDQARADLERRNQILEALNELAALATASLELQPIFDKVISVTSQLIDCTSAYVSQIDLNSRTTTVVAEYFGPEASEKEKRSDLGVSYDLEKEFGTPWETMETRVEPYVLQVDDPNLPEAERAHMEEYGARSILGIPLMVEGTPVAEVEFWDSRARRDFTADEIEVVQTVARQVAVPLENARLYGKMLRELEERRQLEFQIQESHERRGRQVQLSTQISKEIVGAANLGELYQRVVNQVKEQFGFYHVQLLRYNPTADAVVLMAGYGEIGAKMKANNHRMPMGVGLIGAAAATGRSFLRPDVTQDPNWQANPLLPETKGELAVPIMLGDEVLGVIDVQSSVAGALDEDDQLAIEGLCNQTAVAIESTRLRQEMQEQLLELNQLQRIMSREGWQNYRGQKARTKGYRFDQSAVKPVTEGDMKPTTGPLRESSWATRPLGGRPPGTLSRSLSVRGEIIGALGIRDDPNQPLSAEDQELLDSISVQVAEALENARLLEQTQKHAVEMEAVAQVSAAASSILEADRLLHSVTRLTKERFNLYHVSVFTLEDSKLELAAGTLLPKESLARNLSPEIDILEQGSLVARAARARKPIMNNDISHAGGLMARPTLPLSRSELAIPLIVGDQVLGVIDLQSDSPGRFGEADVQIHTSLAAQVAVALQNAKLYAEQLQTTERLREVDRLKSEFLASMSHELRTPLNSIIGFADVLLEGIDGPLNERMVEDVTLIRDSGRHLRALIGEMLDMSKIEAGVMELYYEEIDLPALAQEILANARTLAKDKDLEIQLELAPGLETVEADRTRLTQILLNLMGNAVKFTEKGSIVLSLEQRGGRLLASVQDTGIGIRQEDIPAIFEQFRQVDGSLTRKAGGTGLGVPISRSLVELHGGEMWVESEPGVGSTFLFSIPMEKPRAS